MDSAVLHVVLPELILAIGAMALLMIGVFMPGEEKAGRVVSWLAIGVLLLATAAVFTGSGTATVFEGAFVSDDLTRFLKILILVAAALTLLMTFDDFGRARLLLFEYPVLMLLASLGMLMMVSANDLIALYLGLELQNLALYVIAAFKRDDVRSSEAGLKYFVLSALSSGLLLYGASLLYGVTGATSYAAIAAAAKAPDMAANIALTVGLVFVLVGIAFKIAAVPFHMWTPDVYQGAPTPVTAFFSSAAKVAAMAMLLRFTQSALPGAASQWQQIVIFLSIASMALGAFAAIGQTNIKRLLAYSSIGHIGFALIGLARKQRRGHRRRSDLSRDLCADDARRLCLRSVDAPQRRQCRRHFRAFGPRQNESAVRVHPGAIDVFAGGNSAARRLLGEVVRLPAGHQGRALSALRHRRCHERRRRLLLLEDREDHVLRRAGRSLRAERRQDVCGNGALGGVHARIRAAFYRRRARRCRHGRCHGIEARCSVVDWR